MVKRFKQKIIDIIIDSLDSKSVPLTPGNQILDFIHIDVLRGYMKIIENLDLLPNKSNIGGNRKRIFT